MQQKKRKLHEEEQEAWQKDRRGKKKRVPQRDIAAASFSISAEEEEETQVYVVQSGDNLSKIAKALLDDAARWKDIFEANKDTLKDPSLIQVGQKLIIPPK